VSVHTGAGRRAGVDELPRSDTPTPDRRHHAPDAARRGAEGYDIFLNFLNREDGCEKVVLST
jgi:hypothetical protein